jgi:hypothetical protein
MAKSAQDVLFERKGQQVEILSCQSDEKYLNKNSLFPKENF